MDDRRLCEFVACYGLQPGYFDRTGTGEEEPLTQRPLDGCLTSCVPTPPDIADQLLAYRKRCGSTDGSDGSSNVKLGAATDSFVPIAAFRALSASSSGADRIAVAESTATSTSAAAAAGDTTGGHDGGGGRAPLAAAQHDMCPAASALIPALTLSDAAHQWSTHGYDNMLVDPSRCAPFVFPEGIRLFDGARVPPVPQPRHMAASNAAAASSTATGASALSSTASSASPHGFVSGFNLLSHDPRAVQSTHPSSTHTFVLTINDDKASCLYGHVLTRWHPVSQPERIAVMRMQIAAHAMLTAKRAAVERAAAKAARAAERAEGGGADAAAADADGDNDGSDDDGVAEGIEGITPELLAPASQCMEPSALLIVTPEPLIETIRGLLFSLDSHLAPGERLTSVHAAVVYRCLGGDVAVPLALAPVQQPLSLTAVSASTSQEAAAAPPAIQSAAAVDEVETRETTSKVLLPLLRSGLSSMPIEGSARNNNNSSSNNRRTSMAGDSHSNDCGAAGVDSDHGDDGGNDYGLACIHLPWCCANHSHPLVSSTAAPGSEPSSALEQATSHCRCPRHAGTLVLPPASAYSWELPQLPWSCNQCHSSYPGVTRRALQDAAASAASAASTSVTVPVDGAAVASSTTADALPHSGDDDAGAEAGGGGAGADDDDAPSASVLPTQTAERPVRQPRYWAGPLRSHIRCVETRACFSCVAGSRLPAVAGASGSGAAIDDCNQSMAIDPLLAHVPGIHCVGSVGCTSSEAPAALTQPPSVDMTTPSSSSVAVATGNSNVRPEAGSSRLPPLSRPCVPLPFSLPAVPAPPPASKSATLSSSGTTGSAASGNANSSSTAASGGGGGGEDCFQPLDVDPRPLFALVQPRNVIAIVTALLCERNVLVVSKDTSILPDVMSTLLSLLHPFKWCGAYIPLIPHSQSLTVSDVLAAPLPVFAGASPSVVRESPPVYVSGYGFADYCDSDDEDEEDGAGNGNGSGAVSSSCGSSGFTHFRIGERSNPRPVLTAIRTSGANSVSNSGSSSSGGVDGSTATLHGNHQRQHHRQPSSLPLQWAPPDPRSWRRFSHILGPRTMDVVERMVKEEADRRAKFAKAAAASASSAAVSSASASAAASSGGNGIGSGSGEASRPSGGYSGFASSLRRGSSNGSSRRSSSQPAPASASSSAAAAAGGGSSSSNPAAESTAVDAPTASPVLSAPRSWLSLLTSSSSTSAASAGGKGASAAASEQSATAANEEGSPVAGDHDDGSGVSSDGNGYDSTAPYFVIGSATGVPIGAGVGSGGSGSGKGHNHSRRRSAPAFAFASSAAAASSSSSASMSAYRMVDAVTSDGTSVLHGPGSAGSGGGEPGSSSGGLLSSSASMLTAANTMLTEAVLDPAAAVGNATRLLLQSTWELSLGLGLPLPNADDEIEYGSHGPEASNALPTAQQQRRGNFLGGGRGRRGSSGGELPSRRSRTGAGSSSGSSGGGAAAGSSSSRERDGSNTNSNSKRMFAAGDRASQCSVVILDLDNDSVSPNYLPPSHLLPARLSMRLWRAIIKHANLWPWARVGAPVPPPLPHFPTGTSTAEIQAAVSCWQEMAQAAIRKGWMSVGQVKKRFGGNGNGDEGEHDGGSDDASDHAYDDDDGNAESTSAATRSSGSGSSGCFSPFASLASEPIGPVPVWMHTPTTLSSPAASASTSLPAFASSMISSTSPLSTLSADCLFNTSSGRGGAPAAHRVPLVLQRHPAADGTSTEVQATISGAAAKAPSSSGGFRPPVSSSASLPPLPPSRKPSGIFNLWGWATSGGGSGSNSPETDAAPATAATAAAGGATGGAAGAALVQGVSGAGVRGARSKGAKRSNHKPTPKRHSYSNSSSSLLSALGFSLSASSDSEGTGGSGSALRMKAAAHASLRAIDYLHSDDDDDDDEDDAGGAADFETSTSSSSSSSSSSSAAIVRRYTPDPNDCAPIPLTPPWGMWRRGLLVLQLEGPAPGRTGLGVHRLGMRMAHSLAAMVVPHAPAPSWQRLLTVKLDHSHRAGRRRHSHHHHSSRASGPSSTLASAADGAATSSVITVTVPEPPLHFARVRSAFLSVLVSLFGGYRLYARATLVGGDNGDASTPTGAAAAGSSKAGGAPTGSSTASSSAHAVNGGNGLASAGRVEGRGADVGEEDDDDANVTLDFDDVNDVEGADADGDGVQRPVLDVDAAAAGDDDAANKHGAAHLRADDDNTAVSDGAQVGPHQHHHRPYRNSNAPSTLSSLDVSVDSLLVDVQLPSPSSAAAAAAAASTSALVAEVQATPDQPAASFSAGPGAATAASPGTSGDNPPSCSANDAATAAADITSTAAAAAATAASTTIKPSPSKEQLVVEAAASILQRSAASDEGLLPSSAASAAAAVEPLENAPAATATVSPLTPAPAAAVVSSVAVAAAAGTAAPSPIPPFVINSSSNSNSSNSSNNNNTNHLGTDNGTTSPALPLMLSPATPVSRGQGYTSSYSIGGIGGGGAGLRRETSTGSANSTGPITAVFGGGAASVGSRGSRTGSQQHDSPPNLQYHGHRIGTPSSSLAAAAAAAAMAGAAVTPTPRARNSSHDATTNASSSSSGSTGAGLAGGSSTSSTGLHHRVEHYRAHAASLASVASISSVERHALSSSSSNNNNGSSRSLTTSAGAAAGNTSIGAGAAGAAGTSIAATPNDDLVSLVAQPFVRSVGLTSPLSSPPPVSSGHFSSSSSGSGGIGGTRLGRAGTASSVEQHLHVSGSGNSRSDAADGGLGLAGVVGGSRLRLGSETAPWFPARGAGAGPGRSRGMSGHSNSTPLSRSSSRHSVDTSSHELTSLSSPMAASASAAAALALAPGSPPSSSSSSSSFADHARSGTASGTAVTGGGGSVQVVGRDGIIMMLGSPVSSYSTAAVGVTSATATGGTAAAQATEQQRQQSSADSADAAARTPAKPANHEESEAEVTLAPDGDGVAAVSGPSSAPSADASVRRPAQPSTAPVPTPSASSSSGPARIEVAFDKWSFLAAECSGSAAGGGMANSSNGGNGSNAGFNSGSTTEPILSHIVLATEMFEVFLQERVIGEAGGSVVSGNGAVGGAVLSGSGGGMARRLAALDPALRHLITVPIGSRKADARLEASAPSAASTDNDADAGNGGGQTGATEPAPQPTTTDAASTTSISSSSSASMANASMAISGPDPDLFDRSCFRRMFARQWRHSQLRGRPFSGQLWKAMRGTLSKSWSLRLFDLRNGVMAYYAGSDAILAAGVRIAAIKTQLAGLPHGALVTSNAKSSKTAASTATTASASAAATATALLPGAEGDGDVESTASAPLTGADAGDSAASSVTPGEEDRTIAERPAATVAPDQPPIRHSSSSSSSSDQPSHTAQGEGAANAQTATAVPIGETNASNGGGSNSRSSSSRGGLLRSGGALPSSSSSSSARTVTFSLPAGSAAAIAGAAAPSTAAAAGASPAASTAAAPPAAPAAAPVDKRAQLQEELYREQAALDELRRISYRGSFYLVPGRTLIRIPASAAAVAAGIESAAAGTMAAGGAAASSSVAVSGGDAASSSSQAKGKTKSSGGTELSFPTRYVFQLVNPAVSRQQQHQQQSGGAGSRVASGAAGQSPYGAVAASADSQQEVGAASSLAGRHQDILTLCASSSAERREWILRMRACLRTGVGGGYGVHTNGHQQQQQLEVNGGADSGGASGAQAGDSGGDGGGVDRSLHVLYLGLGLM